MVEQKETVKLRGGERKIGISAGLWFNLIVWLAEEFSLKDWKPADGGGRAQY